MKTSSSAGGSANSQSALDLLASPGLEYGDGARVKIDGASAAGGLHVGASRFGLDGLDSLLDDEASAVEVDIAPREPEHFASAHAAAGIPVVSFDGGAMCGMTRAWTLADCEEQPFDRQILGRPVRSGSSQCGGRRSSAASRRSFRGTVNQCRS